MHKNRELIPILKKALQVLGFILIGVIVCAVLTIIVWRKVPTADDALISNAIRSGFEEIAKAKLPAGEQIEITSSPLRGATEIFVKYKYLTDKERLTLREIAEQMGFSSNRTINITFQPQK